MKPMNVISHSLLEPGAPASSTLLIMVNDVFGKLEKGTKMLKLLTCSDSGTVFNPSVRWAG